MEIIAALTSSHVIGKDNTLLWHISEDQQLFKQITINHTVIMGRKTWESIPEKFRPLPNRNNIVVSSKLSQIKGAEVCSDLPSAIERAQSFGSKIFVIGGESIYTQSLSLCEGMHLSWIKKDYEGDAYFPPFNEQDWEITKEVAYEEFIYKHYRRKKE